MNNLLKRLLGAMLCALVDLLEKREAKAVLGDKASEHLARLREAVSELAGADAQDLQTPPQHQNVSLGRIVHFVTQGGAHRPAIIVETWGNKEPLESGCAVNLRVFADGANDAVHAPDGCAPAEEWQASVTYSEAHGGRTWHWPERE